MLERAGWNAAELLLYASLFLIAHALSAILLFPGYYDPFWAVHADHYIPAARAELPASFFLAWPRPVGQYFFWTIGHLGTRGSMACILIAVALNCALVAVIVRKLLGL